MGMLSYTSSVCVSFSLCLAFSDTIFFVQRGNNADTHTRAMRHQPRSQETPASLTNNQHIIRAAYMWLESVPIMASWLLIVPPCPPVYLSACVLFLFFLFFLTLLGLHTCWFAHLLHFLSFCFFLSVWTCWYVSLSQISLSVAWGENLLYSMPTVTKCCQICDFLQYLDSWYLKWFKLLTQKFIFVLCGGHDSETCRSSTFYAVWLISSVLSRGQPELSGNATLVAV